MDNPGIWQLIRSINSSLQTTYSSVTEMITSRQNITSRDLGLLVAVLTFEPDDTTPSHLLVRSPYNSAESFQTRLNHLVEHGLLSEISSHAYHLSDAGRQVVDQFILEARQAIAQADPLEPAESTRLAELLSRLVDSSLATPPPPDVWSISLSHKLMPAPQPPLPFTEQAISCLFAYRDDSHLAAWQSSGLSATALEVLSLVWCQEVKSLAQVIEKLSSREHSEHVYQDAITELHANHFITGMRGSLKITTEGKFFRDQVEADTDCYFFTPWNSLLDSQKDELVELLNKLQAGLQI
jgi:hypothetical protein